MSSKALIGVPRGVAEIRPVLLDPGYTGGRNEMKNTVKPTTPPRRLKAHQWSVLTANLAEHFDSALYGFLAPLMGAAFFPQASPLYQLILTYSIYLITFAIRPLGGLFFSNLTYKYGPMKPLVWSCLGVACATGITGILPDAAHIDLVAPILLVLTRSLQSFCASGENAIAGYYLLETSRPQRKHSFSGLYQSSTVLGILLASSLSTIIFSFPQDNQLWRLPFIFGFLLSVSALYIRLTCPLGVNLKHHTSSMRQIYAKNLKTLIACKSLFLPMIPIYGFSYLTYAIPLVFLNPFAAQSTSFPMADLMQQTSVLLWLDALLLPIIALAVHRFSSTSLLLFGMGIFLSSGLVLFGMLSTLSYAAFYALRFTMVCGGVLFSVALLPWTMQLYPSKDKYLLHSIGYSAGTELFGRSAPAICFMLYAATELQASPLLYICGLSLLAGALILRLRGKTHSISTLLRV